MAKVTPCNYCKKPWGEICTQEYCNWAEIQFRADAPPVASLAPKCTKCGVPIYWPSRTGNLCMTCKNGGYDGSSYRGH